MGVVETMRYSHIITYNFYNLGAQRPRRNHYVVIVGSIGYILVNTLVFVENDPKFVKYYCDTS